MKQFSVTNKLKKKATRVIAEHLSAEVATIEEEFDLLDTTDKGKITFHDLKVGMQKLRHQIPDADLQMLMDVGDVNKDGYLDLGEFVAISVPLKKLDNDEHLRIVFEYFDQYKSGYKEEEELRMGLGDELDNNEEIVSSILQDVETNKDGRISYDEFASMMKARTDWGKVRGRFHENGSIIFSLKLSK